MSGNAIGFLPWVTVVLLTTFTNSHAAEVASFNDPCNNYTSLDQPWRGTNATGLDICDRDFKWNGWYRLLYYGMNIRMPESCVDEYRCGTDNPLWLNGPHPQIEDGIVTREVCISTGWACCFYKSTPIQVKVCPGNYSVYEFVSPYFYYSAYCADENTIAPAIDLTNATSVLAITTDSPENLTDPCNISSVLDDKWREGNYKYYGSSGHDDTLVEWSGWYRLYLQGKRAQIPESDWCTSYMSCGGYTSLFLNGPHPRLQDGIVTRDIYGAYDSQCNLYRSNPIQVKACPGDYYIYRLVKPAVSLPMPTYCAAVFDTLNYDPCNNYTTLDQPWRGTNETGLRVCDTDFEWNGWYRLLYNGMNIRMPESCVNRSRCGTYNTLWLNGSHPQIEDGVVTRRVCGRSGSNCCYYRSSPIRVKACPGDYYVYEFVKPAMWCSAAYCADVNTITSNTTAFNATLNLNTMDSPENLTFDPCNFYRSLDHEWRRVNRKYYFSSYSGHDDTLVEWSGWYRLYLQGKSAQIPESDWCYSYISCGGYTALFLNGTHPRPQDGIVTRGIFGTYDSQCNFNRSNPIQVKACPGDYYVYRLVKPAVSLPLPTYCAVVFNTLSYDPCNNYTALDQPWRGTNETGLWICDSLFKWTGWYRLLYYGMNIRMPESCVNESSCGTYITLSLIGRHPQIEDGIVTRGVCENVGWEDCCYYRSIPIRVKACPGNYYVYEFVSPFTCDAAYCADVNSITLNTIPTFASSVTASDINQNNTSDPCSVYSVLDDDWRVTDSMTYNSFDDTLVEWSGWYRLYLRGRSAQIPESDWCWSFMTCGGYTSLLLGGSHPRLQDGIVTREVYGTYVYSFDSRQCNSYRSKPIQVKACPGNFYVYRLVKPPVSLPMPTYCAVVFDTPSYDPCTNYTSLDQQWRGTTEIGGFNSDSDVNWNGWYRLLYNGRSVRMPESCVDVYRCGTYFTLSLNGSHPEKGDEIVTRGVCVNVGWEDCCYYRSIPIRVKACPGDFYVYEFVSPTFYFAAYCADHNFTVSKECKKTFTQKCVDSLVNQIQNSSNPVLSPEIVKKALELQVQEIQTMNSDQNISSANQVLNRTEILVSTLVTQRQDNCSVSISVNGFDVQVFAVGPNVTLKEILKPSLNNTPANSWNSSSDNGIQSAEANAPPSSMNSAQQDKNLNQISENSTGIVGSDCFTAGLNVSSKDIPHISINNAQMDIDLIQISRNNNDSAAVAFMSYTNLSSVLKPSLFNTTNNTNTVNTLMSTVITATLLRTANPQFTTPVNFTLKHIAELDPNGVLFCVYWKDDKWAVDGCALLWTNSSHTVCSCVHLSTFALIMQTGPLTGEEDSDPVLELIGIIAVAVGLIFLSLALLTFAVCRRNQRVTSIPQINLCINLLLAHLLFLLTQNLLRNQHSQRLACAVMAGVVHYFFLTAFVWMLIEAAVLLFHMKNLTKLRSKKQGGRLWKWLVVIGYAVPLVVVGVSAGVVPHGYDRDSCWLKADVLWSFLGPVSFILAANTVIFICILVIVISTLTNMKSKALKIKRPKSEHRVLTSVALKTTIQFIILGCSWILGFFTQDSKAMEIIFLLLNSQQGTFIFFIYCVFNQEVRQLYMKWWKQSHSTSSSLHTENTHTTSSRF